MPDQLTPDQATLGQPPLGQPPLGQAPPGQLPPGQFPPAQLPLNQPLYVIAVRALCEFTAKRGDLDLRFTPAPTAQESIAGHAIVASRRSADDADYQTEIPLSETYDVLHVRGRADGYDAEANQLEEIKTYRGELEAVPDNHRHLHWAQVRLYGWLLCRKLGLDTIRLALVYFDIRSQKETLFTELQTADALRAHFVEHCERFLGWARKELAHRTARDSMLQTLAFPHASFRPGQRELAAAVYRSAVNRHCLMVQAPTGIGKTMGSLFPLLKAWPGQQLDKVLFLTAKSSGRQLALDALNALAPAIPLRVLELVAREKSCEHPDTACHGESCPLARGFYDRVGQARDAALAVARLDREALRTVALGHGVCPYYLSQELARWADVIVGDYNYYFDSNATLFALTEANRWRVSVLVDEAHNLVERARSMYSATLDPTRLRIARRAAPAVLKSTLDKVNRDWNALYKTQAGEYEAGTTLPGGLIAALENVIATMTDFVGEQGAALDPDLLRFYFDAIHFVRIAERFGAHSIFDITISAKPAAKPGACGRHASLCIRNIIPAPHLAPRLARAHSIALFSATLTPAHFYADMLGLPETAVRVDVGSPFTADQLQVRAVANLSTRYRDRDGSMARLVELIATQYERMPGNYLSFFSSFEYLAQVADALIERYPQIPVWQQGRAMTETDQRAFLERYTQDSRGIGFAVLGGSFGEGIDLPGTRLIGAFVATLGLPQLNPVNQQMKARMQQAFGAGYDYAYLFPGLQKVVQAAGRVIRGPLDRGVLYLIDDRYARPEVRRLLPSWWDVEIVQQHCLPEHTSR